MLISTMIKRTPKSAFEKGTPRTRRRSPHPAQRRPAEYFTDPSLSSRRCSSKMPKTAVHRSSWRLPASPLSVTRRGMSRGHARSRRGDRQCGEACQEVMHEAAEVTASVGDGLDQSLIVKKSRKSRRGRTAVTLDRVHLGAQQLPFLAMSARGVTRRPRRTRGRQRARRCRGDSSRTRGRQSAHRCRGGLDQSIKSRRSGSRLRRSGSRPP